MSQQQTSRWLIVCFFVAFFVQQKNFAFAVGDPKNGRNVTLWSEDEWLVSYLAISSQFVVNRQHYDRIAIRTRMDEWSFELSSGNGTRSKRVWTELHLFLDRRLQKDGLNNATNVRVASFCRSPIISPLTNDSTIRVPELTKMDERIAEYFITDGFFRTINFIHCTIDDRRRRPSIHVLVHIYLVTNREFQSLLIIEMDNTTRQVLLDHQARFYTHNYDQNFIFNLNVSNITHTFNSQISFVHMNKLYDTTKGLRSSSPANTSNATILLLIFLFIKIDIYFDVLMN